MSIDEIKIILDRVQNLQPADKANFQMLVVVDCVEKVAYWGLIAVVAIVLGRRIIQGVLTAMRESRSTDELPRV